jgi:hypothetical protein
MDLRSQDKEQKGFFSSCKQTHEARNRTNPLTQRVSKHDFIACIFGDTLVRHHNAIVDNDLRVRSDSSSYRNASARTRTTTQRKPNRE